MSPGCYTFLHLLTSRKGALQIPWSEVLNIFDGIYLSWVPVIWQKTLTFHGYACQDFLNRCETHGSSTGCGNVIPTMMMVKSCFF